MRKRLIWSTVLILIGGFSCAESGGGNDGSGAGGGDGDTSGGSDGDTDGDRDTTVNGGGDADGGPDDWIPTRIGQETVCNGVDDDLNGIIDDVDEGGDGVCDCLNIATVGIPGVWGDGNIFEGWLIERSSIPVVPLLDGILDDATLEPLQVLVFLNVGEGEDGINRQYSDEEVQAVRRWIEAGGGIMTTIGYASYAEEVDNINRILAGYDMYYDTRAVLQKQGDQTVPITEWVDHPTNVGVTAVGVDNGMEVLGGAATVATEDNLNVAKATSAGEGNIFMWGDEWICYDSEWQNLGDYQVETFWLNILKWLTPEDECQVALPPVV